MRYKLSQSNRDNPRKEGGRKMHPFRNLSIGKKYMSAYLLAFLILFISSLVVYMSLSNAKEDFRIANLQSERAMLITEMNSLIKSKSLSALNYIQFQDQDSIDSYVKQSERVDEIILILEPSLSDEQVDLYTQVVDANSNLDELFVEDIANTNNITEDIRQFYSSRISSQLNNVSLYLDYLLDMFDSDQRTSTIAANESQNEGIQTLIISMGFAFLLGLVLFLVISQKISKHLNYLVKASDQIASGNLTVNLPKSHGKDEIGQLTHSINMMKEQLVNMINKISITSNEVQKGSMLLNQSAIEARESASQIATTMDELATGTEAQATYAIDLSKIMTAFSTQIMTINNSSESINNATSEVITETQAGNEYMKKSINQMTTIDLIVKDAVDKVTGLDDQSKQISKLIGVIKDIADQTNLLALNAAIEASRAGEHGKGFAVVADEVRKLAEQVNLSIADITVIVESIQRESKLVSDALLKGNKEVEQGKIDITETGRRIDTIEHSISEMTFNIKAVLEGMEKLAKDSNQVNDGATEIASISEESAAGVQEVSASAEETANSMNNVTNSSSTLLASAKELKELIAVFKL